MQSKRTKRRLALTLFPALVLVAPFLSSAETLAMKNVKIGERPPAMSLPDLQGRLVTLESLAGKPALIVFWSTWSPRSEEILADVKAYGTEFEPRGLSILAVNVEGENLTADRKQGVRDYAARMGLHFPVLLDEQLSTFASYGVVVHPSALLVNGEGIVTYILAGYARSLREELHDNLLKVFGLYVEPPKEAPPEVGYVPKGGALQFYNLGRRMMEMGQIDKALENFAKATERDPGFVEAAVMTARLTLAGGEVDKGEEMVRRLSSDSINRNDVRFLLGYTMLLREKTQAAEAVFRSLLEKAPKEGWGAWGTGLTALAAGDYPRALGLLETANTLHPGNFEAEAFAHTLLKKLWLQGKHLPEEDRLLAIFPSLVETRDRYRRLMGGGQPVP